MTTGPHRRARSFEVMAIYPHRDQGPAGLWPQLFASAQRTEFVVVVWREVASIEHRYHVAAVHVNVRNS